MNNIKLVKKECLILQTIDKKTSHKANAVKTKDSVNEIIKAFLNADKIEYACLFVVGINTGSRISDLVKYRVCDILDIEGNIVDEITMKEQKTGKIRTVYFNKATKKAFEIMLQSKEYQDEWIFTANGSNRKAYITTLDGRRLQKPITRQSAWNNLMKITENMDGHYSTHAMRKTFANFFCQANANDVFVDGRCVTALTQALNHSSSKTTLTYMDIQEMELEAIYMGMNLGYEVLCEYSDVSIQKII